MASLSYPLYRQNFISEWIWHPCHTYFRVDMARMPYPPTDCRSYIKIILNIYLKNIYNS